MFNALKWIHWSWYLSRGSWFWPLILFFLKSKMSYCGTFHTLDLIPLDLIPLDLIPLALIPLDLILEVISFRSYSIRSYSNLPIRSYSIRSYSCLPGIISKSNSGIISKFNMAGIIFSGIISKGLDIIPVFGTCFWGYYSTFWIFFWFLGTCFREY